MFEFVIVSEDETELDLVGTAVMEAHSERSHGGLPVSLFGFPTPPDEPQEEDDTEERPRLLN